MNIDLLNSIIPSTITSIVTIIGFIVTYQSMKKSFKQELERKKISIHIEHMSNMPYRILELMDTFTKHGTKKAINDFKEIMNLIYAYGSKDAILIAAKMQKENYENKMLEERERMKVYSLYILLATQIKYDVTGIAVSPELWMQMKINDYSQKREEFKIANNEIVNEMNLNSNFLIK